MSGLLVLTAAEVEARGLARELGLARVGSSGRARFAGDGVEVRAVGLRAAGLAGGALVDREALALVVSAGTCGALTPALAERGSLVVPEVVLTPGGVPLAVDRRAHAQALAAAARTGRAAATGPLVTVDEVVASPEAKAALGRRTGAIAADMESAVILAAAGARGVAAIVVRGVSDTAGQSLPPELATLVDAGGRTRSARAAALLLRRPGLLGEALALRRGSLVALEAVAAVIGELRRDR